jgi:hypothetical protein
LTCRAFDKRVRAEARFRAPLLRDLPMPHDVIISHSTAGKLTAYAICSELESLGIRCWILPRDLNVGITWDQSFANAVRSCRIMIVVLSDYASRSDRIERQLELAFNNGVMVLPFRTGCHPGPGEVQPSQDSAHWLEVVTPEMAQRLRSLCDLVRGLPFRQTDAYLPVKTLAMDREESPLLSTERLTVPPQGSTTTDQVRLPANDTTGESSASESEQSSLPAFAGADKGELENDGRTLRQPAKTSKWRAIRALLLTLLPFAIVCGVGIWHTKKGYSWGPAKSVAAAKTASIASPSAVKIQRQDRFAASDPGWGTPDANWTVADGKLQVTPLPNSSALVINHAPGLGDGEITAKVAMAKGEDVDQLGGLIFWAKDYNDCYALVVSANGKFAVGRKLVGRWVNPIAKTGNAAIRSGIGQTNKLSVRTEGNLITASINDVQVATLAGEPPRGVSNIGLYGESAETTQNVWEFTDVTVTSVH